MSGAIPDEIDRVFGGDCLAQSVPDYSPRPLQVDFARAVAAAMNTGGIHLFEAGTGIGKSIAYIIPALLSGRRIFVSTATITLQDQLANKDVPAVLTALGSGSRVSVLKGRSNYLCLRKWSRGSSKIEADPDFTRWAETTADGDISSFSHELHSSVWRHFRSDHLDCVGTSCPFRGSCHFYRARSTARKADVLILNHHLLISGLLADEVLPGADVLVIDEGHRLEDAASECLGLALGEGILLPIFDGIAFSEIETERKASLLEKTRRLSALIADLTLGVKEASPWDPVEHMEALEEVAGAASDLNSEVDGSDDLQSVAQASTAVAATARGFLDLSMEEYCCFVEMEGRHPLLKGVPLDVGPDLRNVVYSRFDTTILTSATLTVAGEFDFFMGRLGAWDAAARRFGSPFDYGNQAILSVPDELPPHDSHEDLASVVWKWGRALAETLGGRTLILFTSYRNLKLVRQMAQRELPPGIELFTQGEMSRSGILRDFRESGRAVILGTASFWEGVDLPGSMLQAVVIDRLPFASPGHPLIRARMELIEKRGGSSFAMYSLPLAAVRLRQGVGRLIRSMDDIGVVMIMDRRIVTKGYGRIFLNSIPPFRMVPQSQVLDFVMEHCLVSGVSPLKGGKQDDDPAQT
ncbi:MAG: hypothetical protein JXA64_09235 [Candidatus Fermentibacteraceae bacterium]|nr:hypothetical protein [Candidatus Fermentibacteraceae bacterium]MBN2609281.1 hypothetical protein [Candidatus Fermentibacteraceae bacterium]